MNLKQLFEFLSTLFGTTETNIVARLVWRDENGTVVNEEFAELGFSSGLRPEITVEMNTRRTKR